MYATTFTLQIDSLHGTERLCRSVLFVVPANMWPPKSFEGVFLKYLDVYTEMLDVMHSFFVIVCFSLRAIL